MSRIVCKFGGTSLADADRIQNVLQIVERNPSRSCVVLSAPGKRYASDSKITDLLYLMIKDGKIDRSIFPRIFQRYAEIRDALTPGFDLETEFAQISTHDPSDICYFASRGEYLIAKLAASAAGWKFVDARELLVFDNSGEIDFTASMYACQSISDSRERLVIPGFYGCNASGGISTFSRGGSDVSGAWIAALLHADLYENWTDVNGFFDADPAIIDSPRHVPRIGCHQLEEILRCGANVLHPDALAPLCECGIECEIRSSFAPDIAGTRVCDFADSRIPCVTGRKALWMHLQKKDSACSPVLTDSPVDGGIPVAAVSVFGSDTAQIHRIANEIKPITIIHMQQHFDIIIPREKFVETVRFIYEACIRKEARQT